MPVVYIDLLFFINFILDSILLIMSGRISGKNFSPLRIIAGGFFGGIYGTSVFFSSLSFLSSGVIAVFASALMLTITYFPFTKLEFLRLMGGYYLSAFLLSGILSALFHFSGRPGIMSNGIYYFPLSTFQLLFATLPLGAVLCFWWKKMKNRLLSYDKYCKVTISLSKKTLCIEGLIDSGCSLTDPYLNRPVIIIDTQMAEKLGANSPTGFRLIPYNTVDSSSGTMKAFTPDLCIIRTDKAEYRCNCTVAVSPAFSGGLAIINPDIFLNWRKENDL